MKHLLSCVVVIAGLSFGQVAFAKSYVYESIDVDIAIHEDTTFTVRETQTFDFDGEYHDAWRVIPHNKFDRIRDVTVYDENGRTLAYSSKSLEKTNPASWGKYTYHKNGGATEIIWYYDAKDETRSWTIEYTVVGGLSFLNDKDELYWNILTDYDVPVQSSNVIITIPDVWDQSPVEWTQEDLQMMAYLNGGYESFSHILDERTASARASGMRPGADFTVALGFPRGLVDRGAYWEDFFFMYWGYIVGVMFLLGTIIWAVFYWYLTEKHNTGRGTIVAEYEPPGGLPPALGEAIVKEHVSRKTWPATIVDLAVRGFVRIEEEEPGKLQKIAVGIGVLLIMELFVRLVLPVILSGAWSLAVILPPIAFIPIIAIGFFRKMHGLNSILRPKEYRIVLQESLKHPDLRRFEKALLRILFRNRETTDVFSTSEIKKLSSSGKARAMGKQFQKLPKTFYEEVADLGLHTHSIHKEKVWKALLIGAIFLSIWGAGFFALLGPMYFLLASLVLSALLAVYMIKFEVKLTNEGNVEREKWLGFKEYLYRVHRYRVQDLTPETFEKYLPYAMVFGMEKKWAKQFEGVVTHEPSWYGAQSSSGFSGSSFFGSSGGFSAAAFSSSLSSSFASTFSSSSGSGGASSGGGSAGGGGGGGGGGAS